MLIQKEIEIDDLSYYEHIDESSLCFDIETTGLNKKYSHITVIGTGFVRQNKILFRQWLLEDPLKEKELLNDFSAYLKGFDNIIQFNGNSFDIPYLKERCRIYDIKDPFENKKNIDIYIKAKKLKKLLKLDSLKQKSLEALFNIHRRDRLSGRDCIYAYTDYLKYNDIRSRDALLLHNEEDITGLLKLNSLFYVEESCSLFNIDNCFFSSEKSDNYIINFSLASAIPFKTEYEDENYAFYLYKNAGQLLIKGQHCRRNYYFENYKDYFYLPEEDRAIHKSVGIYVDKCRRKPAKKESCYESSEDIFYFQPEDIVKPAFRISVKDKSSWFNKKSLQALSEKELKDLNSAFLKKLFN